MELGDDSGDGAAAAQVVAIPSNTAIITVCSHGNTLVTSDYKLIPIDFNELIPEDKKNEDCEWFYMGMVPQGYAATHTPHTIKLFRTVADQYIMPILISSENKDTKIDKIRQILPTFLIEYTKLIMPHIKILLENATEKLGDTTTELLIDTNAKVNSNKTKDDRLKSSEVSDIMNDITNISEEVQDLVNILCALLFHPELIVWCDFIDKNSPSFYEKLFTTTLDLLKENKKEYSWDIICQTSEEEFGWFGDPGKRPKMFSKKKQNELTIINDNLIRSVFQIPDITKAIMFDGSCAIVLNKDIKINNHVTDQSVIHEIQRDTDNLLGSNKITIDPTQAQYVSTQVNALVLGDEDLLKLLNDSFIEHGGIESLRESVLKARPGMPKTFQSSIVNKNIELMTANKNGLLYQVELNQFLNDAFKNKLPAIRRHKSSTGRLGLPGMGLSTEGLPAEGLSTEGIKRAATLGSYPRSLKVVDQIALKKAKANLKDGSSAAAMDKIDERDLGGSRRKRSRRHKNGSKKSMKRKKKTPARQSIRRKLRRRRMTKKRVL
jgi:hypothetical protein